MIWLAVAALAVAVVLCAAAATFLRQHGPARVALRFAMGLPLDGHRRTDAGWLRRGVRTFDKSGRASSWAHRPHAHRAAFRWVCVVVAVALVWGAFTHPLVTAVAAGLLAAAGAVGGGLLAWRAVVQLRHRRQVAAPLSLALSPVLAVSPQVAAAALEVERGYADTKGGAPVARLGLPDGFHADPDQQKRTERLFESRLGIDCRFTWRMSRKPLLLEVTRAPVPPEHVTLAEIMPAIEKASEGEIVIGKDPNEHIFKGDFLLEDPHWGLSAASRRGKSSFLCLTAAQILRQGGDVVGIDPKMTSLEALVGLPRVQIFNDPRRIEDMWDAIARFRANMEARMEARAKDKTLEFPRSVLFLDEVNMFSAMSLTHWKSVKAKEDPAMPPVWSDIAAVGWMGAQFRCSLVLVGQRLDAKATGGADIRDSLGFRGLAGFTPQAWGFLIGTTPIPRSQKPRGRFIFVASGTHTWVQVAYATEQEIRDLATSGATSGASPATPVTGSDDLEGRGTAPTPLPVRYGLREASSDGLGVIDMRYEALKKARQTDPEFPAGRVTPTGTTYTANELTVWHEARESRKASA
jgi:hypothetical protein